MVQKQIMVPLDLTLEEIRLIRAIVTGWPEHGRMQQVSQIAETLPQFDRLDQVIMRLLRRGLLIKRQYGAIVPYWTYGLNRDILTDAAVRVIMDRTDPHPGPTLTHLLADQAVRPYYVRLAARMKPTSKDLDEVLVVANTVRRVIDALLANSIPFQVGTDEDGSAFFTVSDDKYLFRVTEIILEIVKQMTSEVDGVVQVDIKRKVIE